MSNASAKAKRQSLTALIVLDFVVIILMAVVTFQLNYRINEEEKTSYMTVMDVTEQLAKLPMEVSETHAMFTGYFDYYEVPYLEGYQAASDRISDTLSALDQETRFGNEIDTYLRVLQTIQAYQMASVEALSTKAFLDGEDYREIIYLKMLFEDMEAETQRLQLHGQTFLLEEHNRYLEVSNRRQEAMFGIFLLLLLMVLLLSGIMGRRVYDDFKKQSELELALSKKIFESERNERQLKEQQLINLRAQINPHFLFNTLNIIGKTAVLKDTDKTLELLESTSVMLRYAMDNMEKLVSLGDEMRAVAAYVMIQQTRFISRIRFKIDFDEGWSHLLIPPMLIQPLVENAVKHGLAETTNGGVVSVKVAVCDEWLTIRIADNGIGMDPEKATEKSSIGLYNVRKRLELQYRSKELLTIKSKPGAYTVITLRIPKEVQVDDTADGC